MLSNVYLSVSDKDLSEDNHLEKRFYPLIVLAKPG